MPRFIFFFSSRRRHTRCLSDWSSDVCSSDLRLEDNFVISKNGKEVLPLSKEGSHTCLLDGLCFAPSYSAYFHHDKYCLETALSGTSTISKIRDRKSVV